MHRPQVTAMEEKCMSQRAVDFETARLVSVAQALARLGATPVLIERVTGFGPRWVRGLVRQHGGPLAQRPRDPRYFDEDAGRRLDGWYYLTMYLDQPCNVSMGTRILEAYLAYRAAQQPGVLDINDCAQVVELLEAGEATVGTCRECHGGHLVFSEGRTCPECFLLARTFCRHCHKQLEEGARHTTLYCADCSDSPERISLLRRLRRMRRSGTQGQMPEVGLPGAGLPQLSGSWLGRSNRNRANGLIDW